MSALPGLPTGELRKLAKRMRAESTAVHRSQAKASWPTYLHPEGRSVGLGQAAAMIERRIARIERAECAAHKKPRRRYMVTRCKRCNAMIEKEIYR